MEEILAVIGDYKLSAVIIAVLINVVTGAVKLPIKRAAQKMENGKKLTRFITFLPVVLGFGLTAAYEAAFCGGVKIDGDFVSLWLGASSLSLAVYAFIEKFFPAGKKPLSEEEVRENAALIERLEEKLAPPAEEKAEAKKIVLRGKDNGTETEEK